MRLRLLLALPLLLAAAPAAPPAHPALWKIADHDTTIYLLGTIHALPANYRWTDAGIERAIAAAQSLTLETVLDKDPEALGRLLLQMGKGQNLPPLAERVPAAKRAALARLVKASGFPPALLDQMKTWAAAVVLTGAAMREIGVSGEDGVEGQLTKRFRAAGKPVDGLESNAQQLGFFDALPEPAQRGFLLATLDDPAKSRADFDAMVGAWARGDAAAIQRTFAKDPEFTPALRDRLIRRRDRAWAQLLAARMQQPGTVLVAVGAGHLVGPDAVQWMLLPKGYKAVRVQ